MSAKINASGILQKENGLENKSVSADTDKKSDTSTATAKLMENKLPRSDLLEVLWALQFLDETPGSFCTGGELSESYMYGSDEVTVEGVGKIPFPITKEYVDKLKAIAEQAPHGRGTETIVDTSVRNTLQIDASKVSTGARPDVYDGDWARDLFDDEAGIALGLDCDVIKFTLYKLLLYEPGSFFAKHRDTEKVEGMFGTLVVQCPSEFKGGKFIVSHNGETKTFVQDDKKGFSYIALYADCEHEIEPIESGYRVALVYSMSYKGAGNPPSVDTTKYHRLATTIARLDEFRSKILCVPLHHQYTTASLSQYGKGALKGKDRNKFEAFASAGDFNERNVVIAKLRRVDHEYGEVFYGEFCDIHGKEKFDPEVEAAYKEDGSLITRNEIAHINSLLKWFDYESCDCSGELLADQDEAAALWGDGVTGVEVTGNEGATKETLYSAYVMLMYRPKSSDGGSPVKKRARA